MFNPVKITNDQVNLAPPPAAGAAPFQPSSQAQSHPNVKAVAGGVIGGVLGSLVLLGLAIFWKRYNSRSIAESDSENTPNPYDQPPYTPYDDDPRELSGEEVYAKEMKGSVLNHELEAEVPDLALLAPAELESPNPQCYEKDSAPCESPILPVAESTGGTEGESTREGSLKEMHVQPVEGEHVIREGSLREMSMVSDAEAVGEGLGIARTETRSVSMLVDDEVADEITPIKTNGQ